MKRIAVIAVVVPSDIEKRLPESMISVDPTAMMPTMIVARAPTSSSETMSRPSTSVPSQCAADGGRSFDAMSIS